MKRPGCAVWCAVSAWYSLGSIGFAQTVDFESVPVGARWGQDYGHSPGEVVLSQDDIDMSVEHFFLGTFVGFNVAEVGGVYAEFVPTTHLALDNISVKFDFTGLGFDVTMVTLDYWEFGGANSFAANDDIIFQLAALTDLPADVAPGVTASADVNAITLTGNIDSLLVGGQELGIDNIVAIPEPTTAALLTLGGAILLRRRRKGAK